MPISTIGTDGLSTSPTLTTPKATTTIGVGNATPAASGAGITFPATQSASSDVNTLDDYEEGTFAPTIRGTTTVGTASYNRQNGSYVKVGQLVHFQLYVDWTSGTGTGDLEVGSLPFNTANDTTYPAVTIGYANNVALTANTTPTALLRNNGNAIYFYQIPSGGGSSFTIPYDGVGVLIIAGTYKTGS